MARRWIALVAGGLRDRLALIALSALGIAVIQILFAIFVPTLGGMSVIAQYIQKILPSSVRAILGGESIDLSTSNGFLAIGALHPLALVLGAAFAIGHPVRSFAWQIQSGTIELILARPVRRWVYATAQIAVLAAGAAAIAAVGWFGSYLGSIIVVLPHPFDAAGFVRIAGLGCLLMLGVGGVASAIAAASSDAARAATIAAIFPVFSYLLHLAAQLWPPMSVLRWASFMQYYSPHRILAEGAVPPGSIAALGGLALAGSLAAVVIFVRRDL